MIILNFLGSHADDFCMFTIGVFLFAIVCTVIAMRTCHNNNKGNVFTDIFFGFANLSATVISGTLTLTVICYIIGFFVH